MVPFDNVEGGVSAASPTFTGVATFGSNITVTAAGSTQGTATALAASYNVVTTATANQGVILPSPLNTAPIYVVNNSGVILNIYPQSGGKIGGMTTNASINVPTGTQVYMFIPLSATVWALSVGLGAPTGNAAYNPLFKLGSTDNTTELSVINSGGTAVFKIPGNGGSNSFPVGGLQLLNLWMDMPSVTASNEIVGASGAGASVTYGTTSVGLLLKSAASSTANPAINQNAQVTGTVDLCRWQKNGTTLATMDTNGYLLHLEAIIAKSADYTATAADRTILVDASGAARTITLPAVASHTGRVYVIKKTDSSINSVTVDGNASETIDGATTKVLITQYDAVQIQSDGATWHIIG